MVHSVAGALRDGRLIGGRPLRDRHHSASLPALVGGGQRARPGEVSLAHLGVLLPTFQSTGLLSVPQPSHGSPTHITFLFLIRFIERKANRHVANRLPRRKPKAAATAKPAATAAPRR
jgi:hypothetical protein